MALHLKIAKNWNELNFSQLQNISYLLYNYQLKVERLPKEKAKEFEISTYCNVVKNLLASNGIFKYYAALKELTFEHHKTYSQFIFKAVNRTIFTDPIIIKNTAYYAPFSRLSNCTIGEFAHMDSMYYHWHNSNNKAYLNQLCASLYRIKNKNEQEHDVRVSFNKSTISKHVNIISTLPLKVRLAMAFSFMGCRNHIVSLYKTVFPNPPKSNKDQKNTKPKYVPFGQIISQKVDFNPASIDIAYNLNVYTFFSIYENELQQLKFAK